MAEREVTLDRTQIMKALRSLGRGEAHIDSLPFSGHRHAQHDDEVERGDRGEVPEAARARVEACVLGLNLAMPTLLDDVDDAVDQVYAALPERLYMIDREGVVTHQAAPGPFGFDVDAWEKAIQEVISA